MSPSVTATARDAPSRSGLPDRPEPAPAAHARSHAAAASDAAIRPRTTRFASAPASSHARNAPVPSGDMALERRHGHLRPADHAGREVGLEVPLDPACIARP